MRWMLTKKTDKYTEEYVASFNGLPAECDLVEYISSITTIAVLLDKGKANFDGVEWLLEELDILNKD